MRRLPAVAAFCLVAGCGGPVEPNDDTVRLIAEEAVVTDNTVTLRLVNASGVAVGYNLCFSRLQRQTVSAWVSAEGGRTCLTPAYGLLPQSETTERRMLPPDLAAGHYRIMTDVDWSHTHRLELISNPFEVR